MKSWQSYIGISIMFIGILLIFQGIWDTNVIGSLVGCVVMFAGVIQIFIDAIDTLEKKVEELSLSRVTS